MVGYSKRNGITECREVAAEIRYRGFAAGLRYVVRGTGEGVALTLHCIHLDRLLFEFAVPYLGEVKVCLECRRELALRTVERPRLMLPIDCGRIGYNCRKCGGEYTSTDAMTCTCEGRREECRQNAENFVDWNKYQELVARK